MTRTTPHRVSRPSPSSRSRHLAAMVALSALYACGDETSSLGQGGDGATGNPGGGTGEGAGNPDGGAPGTGNSSTSIMIGDGGSGVGGSTFVCDPAAEPGSLYELYAESQDIDDVEPVSMCKYRGDVLLIVNIAAN